jgi:hypothetical protein
MGRPKGIPVQVLFESVCFMENSFRHSMDVRFMLRIFPPVFNELLRKSPSLKRQTPGKTAASWR